MLGCKFPMGKTHVLHGTISFSRGLSLGFNTCSCELKHQVGSLPLPHLTNLLFYFDSATHPDLGRVPALPLGLFLFLLNERIELEVSWIPLGTESSRILYLSTGSLLSLGPASLSHRSVTSLILLASTVE